MHYHASPALPCITCITMHHLHYHASPALPVQYDDIYIYIYIHIYNDIVWPSSKRSQLEVQHDYQPKDFAFHFHHIFIYLPARAFQEALQMTSERFKSPVYICAAYFTPPVLEPSLLLLHRRSSLLDDAETCPPLQPWPRWNTDPSGVPSIGHAGTTSSTIKQNPTCPIRKSIGPQIFDDKSA